MSDFLPELQLPARIHQHWLYSGLDSPEHCLDRDHFDRYPHEISYHYNSRGFRDHEWPETLPELREAIWCVGDSFTVGLGSPFQHIWPQVLARILGRRTINISMDGASNEWIARRARLIAGVIDPLHMVIMWSYFNRREDPDHTREDHDRRLWWAETTDQEDCENFQHCLESVDSQVRHDVIHAVIPGARVKDVLTLQKHAVDSGQLIDWPMQDDPALQSMMSGKKYLGALPMLDLARDAHHFDIMTSQEIVRRIRALI